MVYLVLCEMSIRMVGLSERSVAGEQQVQQQRAFCIPVDRRMEYHDPESKWDIEEFGGGSLNTRMSEKRMDCVR